MDNLRDRLNSEYWDKSNFISKSSIYLLSFIVLLFLPLYGFYKKEDEAAIVEDCDLVNIFFPDDALHSPIMSNRFYLALVHKKPVIVTEGSVQAALVKEYGLGVVTGDCVTLDKDIKCFLSAFDYALFCKKCNELLSLFVDEHRAFEQAVTAFLQE